MKALKGILFGIGFYQAGSTLLPFAKIINSHYILQEKDLKEEYGHGSVLITGATKGLGYQLSQEIASRGLNLILMARSEEKMKEIKEDFESKFNITVDYIVYDFSKPNKEGLNNLKEKNISLLINNVGFLDNNNISLKIVKEMIDINSYSYQSIIHSAIKPICKSESSAKRGIVNIGSQKAEREDDAPSLYFATKKNCNNYAKAFRLEYEGKNINHFLVMPGIMRTPMLEDYAAGFAKTYKGRLVSDEPEYIAKRSLDMIAKGEKVTYGTERHSFLRVWYENFWPFVWAWSKGMDIIYSK